MMCTSGGQYIEAIWHSYNDAKIRIKVQISQYCIRAYLNLVETIQYFNWQHVNIANDTKHSSDLLYISELRSSQPIIRVVR